MSEVARTLNRTADAERFAQAAQAATTAWQNKYLSAVGNVVPDTATALALALSLDLIPDEVPLRRQAASRLSRNVRFNDFKITSGFVGTSVLARALTKAGEVEVAYAMLYQRKCPSYLYPVTMGATSIWERWDSMLPDGTVNPGSMTSFNHHALGSIAHWLHTDVGGLEAIEPGWRVFRARPWPNEELAWAETVFESPYGRIELKWTIDDEERCNITLQVPPNSSAVVSLPGDQGNHDVRVDQVVGSGLHGFEYRFSQAKWPPKPILPPWGRAEF
jgi:alpha-L-rhamnosidase